MAGGLRSILTIAVLIILASAAPGRPQDSGQQPATPAQAPSPPPGLGTPPQVPQGSSGSQSQQGTGPGQESPAPVDTRPLAGAEAITPTLPFSGRSFLLPSLSVWEGGDTNAVLMQGASQLEVAAIPVGSLDLHILGQHNNFNLTDSGGGILYQSAWNDSVGFDDVMISDEYTARRWSFVISDRASYLPQGSLGFGGIGFAGVFNNPQSLGLGTGGQLNPAYSPQQSIVTGQYGTFSETGIGQAQYFLTPRTSISAVGAFGYQYYSEAGLLGGNDRYGVLTVDHQLTPTQTISLAYSVTQLRYDGGSVAVSNNLWRVGYAYRVTNHIALSLLAGPELTFSAERGVFGVRQNWSWAGQGSLGYHGQRGSVTLLYLHYLTPGSGVYQGAQTSVASVSVDRELSRTWSGDATVGWTNNSAISTYSINPAYAGVGSVNGEYASLRLSHNLGRSIRAFAVYNLEREESGAPLVAGSTNRLLVRQIFGVGLEWHARPLGL
jgi:hypothetical protein